MLNLSTLSVRLACATILALSVTPLSGQAQEAKKDSGNGQSESSEAKEAAKKAAASPSDAKPEPKSQPEKKAKRPATLPSFNYASVAHPSVAEQLDLTDEQRAAVAKIINQRATDLASASADERQEILDKADQKLAAVLTPEQLEQLSALTVEHKIRFNFREQEWADVLDWFARQAGLALVMDTSPPGYFTYTSNKAYTPTEALDLLNSVLLTKGFSLVRRDRMLILIDLSGGLPSSLIPRVSEAEIGEYGDFQFISVLFQLAGRPVEEVVQEVESLLGKYGNCVGLPQTGQLLVTETAGKMQAISILISSIPKPKKKERPKPKEPRPRPPPPVLAVYPVKHIAPESAVEMLSILFGSAKFTVDPKADQVMAYAKPGEQEAIKSAVEQMESNRPPDKQPRLEVYPLDLPNPEQLLEQLQAVKPEVQASIDPELERLMVFGTPEDQDATEEMLKKLGSAVEAGGQQVSVYQLEYFEPAELATLIEEFSPRAEVATDAKLRRVVVSAPSQQQEMIKSLVEQLDKESALQDQATLQIHPLDKPLDENLVESLESLVPDAEITLSDDGLQLSVVARLVDQTVVKKMVEQWEKAAGERKEPELQIYPLETELSAGDVSTIESLVPEAEIELSDDGRQLRVVARASDQTAVETVIERLREAAAAQPKPTLEAYPLTQPITESDVDDLSELVPDAKIELSEDKRQLRVVALEREHQEITDWLKQLEEVIASKPQPTLEAYPLSEPLIDTDLEELTELVPGAKITTSEENRQLRVVAVEEEHKKIEEWLKQVEAIKAAEPEPKLQVYPLTQSLANADVQDLEDLVPGADITLAENDRQLRVVALPDEHKKLKERIMQLEVAAAAQPKPALKVYPLEHAFTSSDVQNLSTMVPGADISLGEDGRHLRVMALDSQHEELEELIKQFETAAEAEVQQELKVYSLDHPFTSSDVNDLSTLIPDAKIVLSDDGRQLRVMALQSDHEKLKGLVDELQAAAESELKPLLRVYSLDHTLTDADVSDLSELVPEAEIMLSDDGRQLRVMALRDQHEKLKELVTELETAAAAEMKPKLQIYPLTQPLTQADVSDLSELVPEADITLSEDGRQLRVMALPDDHEKLGQLVEQLETAYTAEVKPELNVYSLSKALDSTVLNTLESLVPEAKITPSNDGKELIVVARSREQDLVKKTLDQIAVSADAAKEQQLEIYQLDGLPADELQTLLEPLVVHSTVTVDAAQDRLVVWGPPREHEAFDRVIGKLREDPLVGTEPVLKFYPVGGKSRFDQLESVLGSLVPDAELTWDEDRGRAMIIATPKEHQQIEQTVGEISGKSGTSVDSTEEQELRVYSLSSTQKTRFDAIQEEILEDLPGVRVVEDEKTGELAVWARPSQHEELGKTFEQLKESGEAKDIRILVAYPINNGTPETVQETLQEVYPNATFTLDEKANRIMVYASLSDQGRIKQSIMQMDVQGAPGNQEELRSYSTGEADPQVIEEMLQELVPDMQLTPDEDANKLFAWGTVRDHQALEKAIEQVREGDPDEKPVIKAYPMQGREVRSLIYMRRVLLDFAPDAAITIDPRGGSIVASATPEDHEKLKQAIDDIVKLDRDSAFELETYTLSELTTEQATETLEQVVPEAEITAGAGPQEIVVWATSKDQERVQAALDKLEDNAGENGGRTLKLYRIQPGMAEQVDSAIEATLPNLEVLSGEGTDRLLVWGTSNDHDRLDQLIQQLEGEMGLDGEQTMKRYELGDVEADDAEQFLEDAVGELKYLPGGEDDELVIRTDEATHKRIATLLEELKEVVAKPEETLRVHQFDEEKLDVDTVYDALTDEDRKDLSIELERSTNSLIVRGPTDRQVEFAQTLDSLVEQLPTEEQTEVVIYKVEQADISDARRLVYSLMRRVSVAANYHNDTLAITATTEQHERIKDMLDQLESTADMRLETYTLETLTADHAMDALERIVRDAEITEGNTPQQLVVWANSKGHERIQTVLGKLDRGADEENGLTLKLHRLRPGIAEDVESAIEATLPNLEVLSGEGTDRLLVWGTSNDHDRLDQLIQQLEGEMGLDGEQTMKRYELGDVEADDAEEFLEDAVGELKYLPGGEDDELVIRTDEATHKRIATLLEELKEVVAKPEETLRVHQFDEEKLDVDTVYDALTDADRKDLSIELERSTNSLIVRGPADRQAEFAKTLDSLVEQLPTEEKTKAVVYRVQQAEVWSAARLLYSLLDDIDISVNDYDDTLAVTATSKQHAEIEDLLDQLENSVKSRLETYSLEQLTIEQATDTLRNVVPEAEVTSGKDPQQIVVWATPEAHERVRATLDKLEQSGADADGRTLKSHRLRPAVTQEVSDAMESTLPNLQVISGEGTERLLVWGTARDHERLSELIQQVESEMGLDGERRMKRYDLGDATVDDAQDLLDDAVGDLEYLSGGGADELVVRADQETHEKIALLLDELKQAVATPEEVLEVYQFDEDQIDVSTLYQSLSDDEMEELSVQVDTDTNSLVVRGPPDRQAEFSRRVTKLGEQLPPPQTPKSVVYRLDRADPESASLLLESLLPDAPVAVDTANRTLAVTATPKEHEKVQELVDQLDSSEASDLVTETYVMKRGNPTAIMSAIRPIVPRATISSDMYNNMLIVTATAEEHEKIEAIVEQADSGGKGELTTKAYSLEYADPRTISLALDDVVPTASISADRLNNMLIVTATETDHQRIRAVLEQADQRGEGELQTKAYLLQLANPSTIAAALRDVVPNARVSPDPTNSMLIVTASPDEHERVQAIVDEADRRGEGELSTKVYSLEFAEPDTLVDSLEPIAPNATVSADVSNRTLIVTASEKDHERIKSVIDQADKRGGGELTTKAYPVKWANPTTISTALTTVVPDARISSDSTNKMLIVTANQEDHEKIEQVLEEADTRGGGQLATRVYTLETASPSTVMLALRPAVPDATVASDPVNQMLIATASTEDHEKIASIVDEVERQSKGELSTKVYNLDFASPGGLYQALRPVAPQATISADYYNDALIVTANAEDHERIKTVIEQADKRGDGELTTKSYGLKWANPITIRSALMGVVPNAMISSDAGNNMLVVTANEEDHAKIKEVLDQADKRGGGELTTKAYPLRRADPDGIMDALEPVVPDATISADDENRMLVVTASEEDHERVQKIVDEADRRGQGELVTEAYSLRRSTPTTLATVLEPIVPDAIIAADRTNQTLVVTATAKDQKLVKRVIEQADQGGEGELVTKAYMLQVANPSTIATALRTAVPNATVSPDPTNQMLVATASAEDHQRIQDIVDEADRRSEGEFTTEVYTLDYANPLALYRSLRPIAPQATISPDSYNNTLIITATAKSHKRIKAVIEQADTRGRGELTTKAYSLKWANPITIRSALMGVVPNAMISSDAGNNMLVVTANEEDHAKIKEVLDQADKRGGGELTTKAYPLRRADPDGIMDALEPVVPDATISADDENRMLVVTASEEDHERVQKIVDEADRRGQGELVTEAYSLKWSDPRALATVLEPIAPDAIIAADRMNSAIVVTATATDQELVKKVIEQADRRGEGEMTTEVYLLTRANPLYVQRALQPLVPNATIGADVTSKTLIVTAPEEDQEKIQKIVEQADRRGEGKLITKVYPFKIADPATVAEALSTLIPNAQMSSDPSTNALIVTGTESDHAEVEPLVEQLDVPSPDTSVLKPYTVKNAEPQEVYQALTQMFSASRNIGIGYQDKTGMIMVFAPAVEQDEVEQAITAIDDATAKRPEATLEVYELEGVDVSTAVDTVRTLLEDETPQIDLQSDITNNQILAIAEPDQHQLIEDAISQLKPVKREMEVFSLERVDPYSARLAIDTMFSDLPFAAMPLVEADPGTQQLIVHATKEQLERIQELLEKMGEGGDAAGRVDSTSMLRVIPFAGDTGEMLRELERIWPQVRGNEIEIVAPPEEEEAEEAEEDAAEEREPPSIPLRSRSTDQGASHQGGHDGKTSAESTAASTGSTRERGEKQTQQTQPTQSSTGQSSGNDQASMSRPPAAASTMFVSAQAPNPPRPDPLPPPPVIADSPGPAEASSAESAETPESAGEPTGAEATEELETAAQPAEPERRQSISAEDVRAALEASRARRRQREEAGATASGPDQPKQPPIVVIAGEGRLTVASRDVEALNMFEELLSTLQRGQRLSFSKGNFSMFRLNNADAEDLAEVLNSLFGRNARSSRGRYGARRPTSRLRVVADNRMNALLVYGSVADRRMVEEMLPILDSPEVPDSLTTEKPRMIPVNNLPAERVLEVLESVYESQLQARRGLRPITIPRGISPEMTSMLELLNATANAPILTLDIDENTNSIVMRAPRRLGEEIEAFIKQLDEQAKEGGTRSISLVPLKGTNTQQIENALRMLMRGSSRRRRFGR